VLMLFILMMLFVNSDDISTDVDDVSIGYVVSIFNALVITDLYVATDVVGT